MLLVFFSLFSTVKINWMFPICWMRRGILQQLNIIHHTAFSLKHIQDILNHSQSQLTFVSCSCRLIANNVKKYAPANKFLLCMLRMDPKKRWHLAALVALWQRHIREVRSFSFLPTAAMSQQQASWIPLDKWFTLPWYCVAFAGSPFKHYLPHISLNTLQVVSWHAQPTFALDLVTCHCDTGTAW